MTDHDATLPPVPAATPAEPRRRLLIGVGIGAAALGLIAGTAAISFAVADEFDDDDDYRTPLGASAEAAPLPGNRSNDITATIAEFTAARDAAVDAAQGDSALSLDRDSRGWEVDVFTDRGTVEVRLDAALAVIALEEPEADDRNDLAPATVLDGDAVNDVISAAIAEAGSGAATDVEGADGDDRPGYSVTLVLADGSELDVYLDADLAVLSTEIDD